MGSKSLALLDWGSKWFSNKERERTNMCLCCFLPPLWNTLRFTQATVKTTITHNNFQHCLVSFSPFVRQPFLKQLYINITNKCDSKRATKHKAICPITSKHQITWNQDWCVLASHKLGQFFFKTVLTMDIVACVLLWTRFTISPKNLNCQSSYFRWKLIYWFFFLWFPGWK